MHWKIILMIPLVCIRIYGIAQEKVTTFGIQIKPIIPSNLVRAGSSTVHQNDINFTLSQEFGHAFGMVIRRGLSKNFSFESGINHIQRNYNLNITDANNNFTGNSRFRIIGYEIPALLLAFVQLGDRFFMNTALGSSIDFFPSDVGSRGEYFNHISLRNSWIKLSLLANAGIEYRTKKSGYFYFGASYHRPFTHTFFSRFTYHSNNHNDQVWTLLSGNYLTFDLRYFFHENPDKPKVKDKTKKKR